MGKQHVIELNGKRYDALTGKVIASDPVPASPSKLTKKPKMPPRGVSIDGFAKAPRQGTTQRNTNTTSAHKAEKSNTLMRTTVSKPKAVKPTSPNKPTPTEIVHSTQADQKRLQHAKAIPKSPTISRFSSAVTQATQKLASPISKSPHSVGTTKVMTANTASAGAAPATSRSLVEKAIAEASPKEAPKLKREKHSARIGRKLHLTPKQVSFGGFAIASLIIGGFLAFQNTANISMRIASSRAGIHGSLPNYQPAGFSIAGGVGYNPGQITVTYKSTSDGRNFKLMQNVSNWNSQALLDNYVATNYPDNQTIQDRGKTVYLYNDSNATWVDGGIWYRIEGNSQLNSNQLLNIAASL